jgi:hypothetical protein
VGPGSGTWAHLGKRFPALISSTFDH